MINKSVKTLALEIALSLKLFATKGAEEEKTRGRKYALEGLKDILKSAQKKVEESLKEKPKIKIKYKARYRKKGVSPFEPRFPQNAFCSTTSDEVPEDTPIKEIEKFAKENTPDGYEFIEVIPIKEK